MRREELDHRVGKLTNKFQSISTNNGLEDEPAQIEESNSED